MPVKTVKMRVSSPTPIAALGSTWLCNTPSCMHQCTRHILWALYFNTCRSHQSIQLLHLAAVNSNVSLLYLIIKESHFIGFWGSGNFDVQNVYLCGCVRVQHIKRRCSDKWGESRWKFTREYYLPNYTSMQKSILFYFAVSDGRITQALQVQAGEVAMNHETNYHKTKSKS